MKKILSITFCLLLFSAMCNAANIPNFKYNQIKPKDKIIFDTDTQTWKPAKNTDNYFINTVDLGKYSSYLNKNGDFAFTTDCAFEFIRNNQLTGYSEHDFSFYDFKLEDNKLVKTKLSEEDVKAIFPDYKIIKLSDFSPNTHSVRVKKDFGESKLIIYNDEDIDLTDYKFSSGDAKFKTYPISSIITVTKPGMIQFSKTTEEDDTEENEPQKDNNKKEFPWFVILIK